MIRLLLLAIFGFLLYTLWTALLRGAFGRKPNLPNAKTPHGEDMVKDPQCGTYVARNEALSATVKGKTYYFCSQKCRDRFRS